MEIDSNYIIATIVSLLLSLNGYLIKTFISNIKELKKAIQDLSVSIKGSQKDIEFIYKMIDSHDNQIEKNTREIEEIKLKINRDGNE